MLELYSIERKHLFFTKKIKYTQDPQNTYLEDRQDISYGQIFFTQFNVYIKKYGLVLDLEKFDKILENPESSFIDLVKVAINVMNYSYNKKDVKNFTKTNNSCECFPYYIKETQQTLYAAVNLDDYHFFECCR